MHFSYVANAGVYDTWAMVNWSTEKIPLVVANLSGKGCKSSVVKLHIIIITSRYKVDWVSWKPKVLTFFVQMRFHPGVTFKRV